MRTISEKDYRKIKHLQKKFYDGVDRYCETLEGGFYEYLNDGDEWEDTGIFWTEWN